MSGALLLAGVLLGPAEPSLPDGNSLVRELARKQRHWEEVLDSYTYDVEVLREELEKDGRVAKRRIRAYEVFYVKGRPVWRLVRDEGQPLDADRQAKVDRAVKEKVDAINEGRSAAELAGVRLSAILERYDFRAVERESLDGRPAIVLDFSPRPGSRPLEHDNVLRVLAGRVWVDEAEREVVRAEIRNTAGVRVLLGLGASVSTVSATFEFRKVGDTVWLPVREETQASGRVMLLKTFRTRVVLSYDHFRRFQVQAEEKVH